MATETLTSTERSSARLAVAGEIAALLATGISNVRLTLADHDLPKEHVVALAGEALERLGWMADRIGKIADEKRLPQWGSADAWIFRAMRVDLAEKLEGLEGKP